jgi:hypothetical protein
MRTKVFDAVADEIERLGEDRVSFCPITADTAEWLQKHPGILLEVRLHWREDGLAELHFTEPD